MPDLTWTPEYVRVLGALGALAAGAALVAIVAALLYAFTGYARALRMAWLFVGLGVAFVGVAGVSIGWPT